MTAQELYELGEKAYAQERYEEALKYYVEAAPESAAAASSIPFCYVNLATEVSVKASGNAGDTAYLVKGQQLAVKLLDSAIRSALVLYRDYPNDPYACNSAGMVICQAINLQYTLVSTGLTIAYNISGTKTTVRKTVMQTVQGDEVVKEEVLWEDVIGKEDYSFVSLNSYDMSDFHIFGPDEKTKQIRKSLETIRNNAVQLAEIMDCMGRGFDGDMLRASAACAMAETEGGDRSMLLAAEWFIARAKQQAAAALTDGAVLANWLELNAGTMDNYQELSVKFAALLRSYHRKGQKPYLAKFYSDASKVPDLGDGVESTGTQQAGKAAAPRGGKLGDVFEVFLTVFAQIGFLRIFPTLLCASIISLFCGGLFNVFSADAGIFIKVFGIVWFILTVGLTFFRSIMNSDEFRDNGSFRIYMITMMGAGLLFSINFPVALVVYLVLWFLSKKYK